MSTYCELLSCDACVHYSFVHGLECIKIWRCDEHYIRHELSCFQYLQSLERDTRHDMTISTLQFTCLFTVYRHLTILPNVPSTLSSTCLVQPPLTCGLTSRMQVRPVATTSWMELILVPYRLPSYSPCSRNRPALMSTSISVLLVKW